MAEGVTNSSANQHSNVQVNKRLWLIRHGLTDWNMHQRFCGRSDIPLSEQGQEQALWIAKQLLQENISVIYTSDLVRACETAEIIASQRATAVQIKKSSDWREMDFGEWEGLTYAQIAEQFKDQLGFFIDPEHHSPPNGESLAHVQQRVMDAFLAIVRSDVMLLTGDAVIISHAGPLRILLCNLLGIAFQRQWQIKLDPGSLSAIDLLPGYGSSEPYAVLSLLNVQIPIPINHPTQGQFSSSELEIMGRFKE
ncbi:MAG TPA: histidine phosphatase family protein [Ktedonobacteraceae bacterium]|nr:histidine phosphatase family protein [Ktedonobacteraceae bacterium]